MNQNSFFSFSVLSLQDIFFGFYFGNENDCFEEIKRSNERKCFNIKINKRREWFEREINRNCFLIL